MNSAQMDQPTHKDIDKVRRQPTTVKRKHSGRSPARTIPTPQQDREIEPAQEAKGAKSEKALPACPHLITVAIRTMDLVVQLEQGEAHNQRHKG